MHFRAEIVLPKVDDLESAIGRIMKPFDENQSPEDEDYSRFQFWDFWVIGGRFSGAKLQAMLDKEKLDLFYKELKDRKVTVSGVTCGKQDLSPSDQIPMVDDLWKDFFPDTGFDKCPLFGHSNNQYDSESTIPGDICELKDVPESLTAETVIFAGYDYDGEELKAEHLTREDYWNGCNHQKTAWDGLFKSALDDYLEYISRCAETYKERVQPREDWLVVSVDYHS